jgi:hypothetical protein
VLRYYRRPLSDTERRSLEAELTQLGSRRRGFLRFTVAAGVLILVIGVPLAISQGREDENLLYLAAFVLAVYVGIIVWVYRENIADTRRREASLRGTLARNEARVLHCRTDAFVGVPEVEDEGPGYFLQVESNLVLYLGGQEYYPTRRFPSDDFELIEVLDHDGIPAAFRIEAHGERLKPAREIARQTKLEMAERDVLPEDLSLIDGTIDDVEARLLEGLAGSRSVSENG